MNSPIQKIDERAWLEMQVIAAISSLKQLSPEHPFVTAIRDVLLEQKPDQLTLDL
jgi:hypothetical protein